MRQRSFIVLTATLAILIFGSVAVYAYDSSHDDQIAKGVRAGGVDIGGMRTDAARAKLEREVTARLSRTLYATYHDARFGLTAATARIRVDAREMVDEALARSRGGNILSRTARGVFGGEVDANVPVRASYSRPAVARLVRRVERRLNRPAQDATLSFSTGSLERVKAKKGRLVRGRELQREVEDALLRPGGDRTVAVSVVSTKPKVTTRQLVDKYPTVIAINRNTYQLGLYKHLKRVKAYTIAVGQQGLETPAGEYTVGDKQINPYWHVPKRAWAGSLAGRVIPPGPENPLKARWIGIVDGAGIHGTADVGSLGSSASHGCIRMAVPDVIELFDRTPYGSKIFIH
jgi:lipoprotein-anchoring transpeptidase ErfK/SrfK